MNEAAGCDPGVVRGKWASCAKRRARELAPAPRDKRIAGNDGDVLQPGGQGGDPPRSPANVDGSANNSPTVTNVRSRTAPVSRSATSSARDPRSSRDTTSVSSTIRSAIAVTLGQRQRDEPVDVLGAVPEIGARQCCQIADGPSARACDEIVELWDGLSMARTVGEASSGDPGCIASTSLRRSLRTPLSSRTAPISPRSA